MPTLNWIGKDKVVNHHRDVPYKILEHQYGFSADKGKQKDPTNSGNKIIRGDNLEALKSLLPEYEGKVDCIYIDPPYNTGNENWVYNDNVNDPKIKKWIHQVVGKEGDDLTRHDKWLCMMYPRIKLLNQLLSKNGVLTISISYHEVFNLVLLLKEIFGNKQIVPVTVQTSGGKPSGGFNYQHEYVIFVVPTDFNPNPMQSAGGQSRSPFEGLTLATFDKVQRPNQAYPIFINKNDGSLAGIGLSLQERIKNGTYIGKTIDFIYNYDEAPENCVAIWPVTSKGKDCVWRLIPSRLQKDWEQGYIKISPNKSKSNSNDFSIQYLPEGVIKKINTGELNVIGTEPNSPTLVFGSNKTVGGQIPTIWSEKSFYTVKGTTLLNEIFQKKSFNYPKPVELVSEILRAVSNKKSIILDSFAGSGTTGHAVLNLNKEDNGDRHFILIEMENYASDVTAERIKKIIKGYNAKEEQIDGTGGSFDYYELGHPLFDEHQNLNEEVPIPKIREYIWYSETRSAFIEPKSSTDTEFLLGSKDRTVYYFVYDKNGLTTLDYDLLSTIKTKGEQYVIYADNCLLSKEFMAKNNIIFKKIPRDISRF